MMAGGSENRCLISTRNCCPPYTLDMLISERTATTARDFTLRVDPTPPAAEPLPKRGGDIGRRSTTRMLTLMTPLLLSPRKRAAVER